MISDLNNMVTGEVVFRAKSDAEDRHSMNFELVRVSCHSVFLSFSSSYPTTPQDENPATDVIMDLGGTAATITAVTTPTGEHRYTTGSEIVGTSELCGHF